MKNKPQTMEEWQEATFNELVSIKELMKEKKLSLADLGLIDTDSLCRLLNITPRTAITWRNNGTLRFKKLGSRYYYKISDIQEMMNEGFARK